MKRQILAYMATVAILAVIFLFGFFTGRKTIAKVVHVDLDADKKTEVEEPKTRRMTNQELAWWLRKKPTREWRYNDDNGVCSVYGYWEKYADKEIPDGILIREDGGEWREPLVEVEE